MSNKLAIGIILGFSIVTHFIFFGIPKETVFDEVHFGKFVSAYYTHQYYFDIHPPLGKLLIAGMGKIVNFSPEFDFGQIGEKYNNNKYMTLRLLPTLAGTLLPLIIYLLCLEIGFSRRSAFLAGFLIIFENSILVQARFILMDAFLLLFGFAALLFYFKFKSHQKWSYLLFAGIFSALSISIKWTGIAFLGIILCLETLRLINRARMGYDGGLLGFKDRHRILSALKSTIPVFRNFWSVILFLVIVPLIIYFSVFVIHFSLLTKSGDGDAFMSPSFQKTLIGNSHQNDLSLETPSIWGKFTEINIEMYSANKTLTATHPYSSKWYAWPFMIRPIYYWVSGEAKIYLIGNPLLWWFSTVATLLLILSMILKKEWRNQTTFFLLGAYLINFLPFIFIGRVMFLYHYLSALIFSIIILSYIIDKEKSKKVIAAIVVLVIGSFIYFAPLTYGLPLTASQYENRVWLSSWR